jgi:hypothetical protein
VYSPERGSVFSVLVQIQAIRTLDDVGKSDKVALSAGELRNVHILPF